MKRFKILSYSLLSLYFIFVSLASASVFTTIKSWATGELLAIAATAIVSIAGSVGGVLFWRILKTLTEAGQFLTTLGNALSDKKITNDEIKAIVSDAKDVFNVWKTTSYSA